MSTLFSRGLRVLLPLQALAKLSREIAAVIQGAEKK
jgi:hypothetical protein